VTSFTKLSNDIDEEAAGDNSGRPVSLSSYGTTFAIGAKNNNGNGDRSGHTFLRLEWKRLSSTRRLISPRSEV
jgi:hypothetical protein